MQELRRRHVLVSAAAAGAAFLILAFLMPRGEILAYLAVCLCAMAAMWKLYTFLYALEQEEPAIPTESAFAPGIDLFVVGTEGEPQDISLDYPAVRIHYTATPESLVPREVLSSTAPLIAIVQRGELPHPSFLSALVPYFADTSLSFVQAATRYDGSGGVAEAFRAQEALGAMEQVPRGTLNAVILRGSGALIARDALEDTWRPGMTWEALGLSMQSLGYTGRFEPRALVLTWAPKTLGEYCMRMLGRGARIVRLMPTVLRAGGLSFAARMQFVGDAAGHAAALLGGLGLVWSGVALLYRGVGPFIIGRGFLVMYACFAISFFITLREVRKLTHGHLSPSLLMFMAGALPSHAASVIHRRTQEQIKNIDRGAIAASFKRAWSFATLRANGSGDTSPAGTPARS